MSQQFERELKDLLDCETQLIHVLPTMAEVASTDELRHAFVEHLAQTHNHVQRLKTVFEQLDLAPKPVKCDGMRGIIREAEAVISKVEKALGWMRR